MAMSMTADDTIRKEFTTGLVNAHALEKQAIDLIKRQLERVENYPEVAARLRQHLAETRRQEERLDRLLDEFDEGRSLFKDLMMRLSGNAGAMAHAMADDEILKNSFANVAFEAFEMACYESLITMAQAGGYSEAEALLRQSLEEEQQTFEWFRSQVGPTTQRYLELKSSGDQASR